MGKVNYSRLNSMARNFIQNKGDIKIDKATAYINSLSTLLENFKLSTPSNNKNITKALEQLNEIKKHTNHLQSHISILEKKIELLEDK